MCYVLWCDVTGSWGWRACFKYRKPQFPFFLIFSLSTSLVCLLLPGRDSLWSFFNVFWLPLQVAATCSCLYFDVIGRFVLFSAVGAGWHSVVCLLTSGCWSDMTADCEFQEMSWGPPFPEVLWSVQRPENSIGQVLSRRGVIPHLMLFVILVWQYWRSQNRLLNRAL